MKISKDVEFESLISDKNKHEILFKFLSQFCYKCEKCGNIPSLNINEEIGKLLIKCNCSSESKNISFENYIKNATINPEKQIFCENHKEINAIKFDLNERKYLCDKCINNFLPINDDFQKEIKKNEKKIINEDEKEKENNESHEKKVQKKNTKESVISSEKEIQEKNINEINNDNENKEEVPPNIHLIKSNDNKFYYIASFIILIAAIILNCIFGNKNLNNKTTEMFDSFDDDNLRNDENENDDLYDKIVVGIDFGSSYSGFAYSLEMSNHIEFDDAISDQKIENTEIILEKETNKLYLFGSEAHREETRDSKYAYFTKMKTELDPELIKKKEKEFTIKAEYPKNYEVNLKTVIKEYLKGMSDKVINQLNSRDSDKSYLKEEIKWIVTTPAIWDEAGKQLTREAAIEAGMNDITIALEPEAASLTIYNDEKNKNAGNIFMLIDAGGYTVDITINKIMNKKGDIKQLSPPYGGALGSMNINNDIVDIIEQIYGKEYIEEVKEKNYGIWKKTLDSIEIKKRNFIGKLSDSDYIKIDIRFEKKFCETKCEKQTTYGKINYDNNNVEIPKSIMENITLNRVNKIIDSIKKLIEINKNIKINHLVLTGGFSNCKILLEQLKKNFNNSGRNIFKLDSPSLSIMKGAVIYGKRPNKIMSRISPYNIGILSVTFDIKNQTCIFYMNISGIDICEIFDKFINKGGSINNNFAVIKTYSPILKTQTEANITIFRSIKENVKDISEKDIEKIGEVILNIPETEKPLEEREIEVKMIFGSCITFEAKNKISGEKIKTSFNYYKRYN